MDLNNYSDVFLIIEIITNIIFHIYLKALIDILTNICSEETLIRNDAYHLVPSCSA